MASAKLFVTVIIIAASVGCSVFAAQQCRRGKSVLSDALILCSAALALAAAIAASALG